MTGILSKLSLSQEQFEALHEALNKKRGTGPVKVDSYALRAILHDHSLMIAELEEPLGPNWPDRTKP